MPQLRRHSRSKLISLNKQRNFTLNPTENSNISDSGATVSGSHFSRNKSIPCKLWIETFRGEKRTKNKEWRLLVNLHCRQVFQGQTCAAQTRLRGWVGGWDSALQRVVAASSGHQCASRRSVPLPSRRASAPP